MKEFVMDEKYEMCMIIGYFELLFLKNSSSSQKSEGCYNPTGLDFMILMLAVLVSDRCQYLKRQNLRILSIRCTSMNIHLKIYASSIDSL